MIKQLLLVLLITLVLSQDVCPAKAVTACQQDLELAIQACEKAAKEKGADQTADINCVKYLLSSRKDCWPCICQVAKKLGYKVKGCVTVVDFVQRLAKMTQLFVAQKASNLLQV